MMNEEQRKKVTTRLRRIEGQVAGIRRMVEEQAYCVDILTQIAAAQAALGQAGNVVLAQHIESCVADAFESGDETERRKKIAELMDIFARYANVRAG